MQAHIDVTDGRLAGFEVPVNIFKEGGQYVAVCGMLGLASHGKTEHEARASMRGVVEAFLEEVIEMGTLTEVLTERGWRKTAAGTKPSSRGVSWVPPKVVTATVASASL
jgi:predicted RNase H-like HicB family nuclease